MAASPVDQTARKAIFEITAKHFRKANLKSDLYAMLAALAETCKNEGRIDNVTVCKIILGA